MCFTVCPQSRDRLLVLLLFLKPASAADCSLLANHSPKWVSEWIVKKISFSSAQLIPSISSGIVCNVSLVKKGKGKKVGDSVLQMAPAKSDPVRGPKSRAPLHWVLAEREDWKEGPCERLAAAQLLNPTLIEFELLCTVLPLFSEREGEGGRGANWNCAGGEHVWSPSEKKILLLKAALRKCCSPKISADLPPNQNNTIVQSNCRGRQTDRTEQNRTEARGLGPGRTANQISRSSNTGYCV